MAGRSGDGGILCHCEQAVTLRKTAFSAGRWTTASLLIRALLQIVQTMALARLLTPADYGLMAIAGATYATVSLFVDMGLSNALIHFPEPSPSVLSTLYWLNLGAAGLMMLAYSALAWPLALLYSHLTLLPVMLIMGLAMPIGALGQQFRVIAEKELRFSTLAVVEVASAILGFVAALIVALLHGGVYALVAALLVTSTVSSFLAWLLLSDNLRPNGQFNLREVKPYLTYGSYRLGDSLLNNLQSQADVFIGGTIVGSAAMGVYTLPRDLTLRLANTVINPVVTRVGLPVMARVQSDKAALKSIYLQTLRMTSSVNFPAYLALAVWADETVAILLGNQWQEAGTYMRLFAIWGMIRSTGNPVGSLLYATGHVRRAFWWNLAMLFVIPILLWLASTLNGIRSMAVSMVGIQVLIFYPIFRLLVQPVSGATFPEYMKELLPPLFASALAAVAGYAVSLLFMQDLWTRFTGGAIAFFVVYVALSHIVNRQWTTAMSELVKPLLGIKR